MLCEVSRECLLCTAPDVPVRDRTPAGMLTPSPVLALLGLTSVLIEQAQATVQVSRQLVRYSNLDVD